MTPRDSKVTYLSILMKKEKCDGWYIRGFLGVVSGSLRSIPFSTLIVLVY